MDGPCQLPNLAGISAGAFAAVIFVVVKIVIIHYIEAILQLNRTRAYNKNLPNMEDVVCKNNPLPTKSHVEFRWMCLRWILFSMHPPLVGYKTPAQDTKILFVLKLKKKIVVVKWAYRCSQSC